MTLTPSTGATNETTTATLPDPLIVLRNMKRHLRDAAEKVASNDDSQRDVNDRSAEIQREIYTSLADMLEWEIGK